MYFAILLKKDIGNCDVGQSVMMPFAIIAYNHRICNLSETGHEWASWFMITTIIEGDRATALVPRWRSPKLSRIDKRYQIEIPIKNPSQVTERLPWYHDDDLASTQSASSPPPLRSSSSSSSSSSSASSSSSISSTSASSSVLPKKYH